MFKGVLGSQQGNFSYKIFYDLGHIIFIILAKHEKKTQSLSIKGSVDDE